LPFGPTFQALLVLHWRLRVVELWRGRLEEDAIGVRGGEQVGLQQAWGLGREHDVREQLEEERAWLVLTQRQCDCDPWRGEGRKDEKNFE